MCDLPLLPLSHFFSFSLFDSINYVRGFQEDAVEESDDEEDDNNEVEGGGSADAELINVVKEKMMSEDASKYNVNRYIQRDTHALSLSYFFIF